VRNKIVIAVGIAGHPVAAAGNSWAFLQWVLGFREAGWDVWMVEGMSSDKLIDRQWQKVDYENSANKSHWEHVVRHFGLEKCATLLIDERADNLEEARTFAGEADLFLNVSGHFKSRVLTFPRATKLYLDLDPGFTQIWSETYGIDMNFKGHDIFFTYGTRLGTPTCRAPTCGLEWKATVPPVVLKYWPCQPVQSAFIKFSTLAHWQGYSWCEWKGEWYTGKSEEFHKLVQVPRSVQGVVELATEVEANAEELKPFVDAGWQLINGMEISQSFSTHEDYLRESSSEFSAAKGGYVVSQGGWFSDRSVCYLASGRPVVLQGTGVERWLPEGKGFHVFSDAIGASKACNKVLENFGEEQREARKLAESFFDSKVVIKSLLENI
jgi:hypothetical protein